MKKLKTKKEVIDWLKDKGISQYSITENLTVNIEGNVNLNNKGLMQIPVNFGVINGIFSCTGNQLTNFDGFPDTAIHILCSKNKIESLKGCPQYIHETFSVEDNPIKSINEEELPKQYGTLVIGSASNTIIQLEYLQKKENQNMLILEKSEVEELLLFYHLNEKIPEKKSVNKKKI